jgi:glycosyltransferase involved in cell wall biosynthesis
MKIVVNTRLLRKNQMDGIGWFTYNTLQHIVKQHPQVEFHFLFDSSIDPLFLFSDNVIPHQLFPPAKHALLNIAWFEFSVKNVLKNIKPNLFLSPDGILCLGWSGKQYGVIHDINFHHNPHDLKWSNRTYYNTFFPKFAKKAIRVGTVSEYSKQDLIHTYHIEANKIDVVYNGVNTFFKPVSEQVKQEQKMKWTNGQDFFIFVGTLHPRKNIIRLLQAFDQFKLQTGVSTKLLIAGKSMYRVEEMEKAHQQMQFHHDVIFTGRLNDEELNKMLGSALALTFVPTFEGFGIPIIEAMQCEVPVICANTTSMPEIAGDAALLVDPFDIRSIKDAMIKIQHEPQLRAELIWKGQKQKNSFSWERSACLLWDGMMKCI